MQRLYYLLIPTMFALVGLFLADVAGADPIRDQHLNATYGTATAVRQECFVLYKAVADTDDVQSVWRPGHEVLIRKVWCETDTGTVTMDIQIDDGTPADVMGVDLVCDSNGEEDTTIDTAAGLMSTTDTLDFAITSVASAPGRLTLCVEYSM